MRVGLIRLGFFAALVIIFVMALIPLPEAFSMFSWQDKVEHVGVFMVLGLLGIASRLSRPPQTLAGVLAYGGLIELVQGMTTYRTADPADLLADACGLVLAGLINRAWMRRTI